MELRQFAVFMNAGSYVIRPKSSSDALICLRSIALMVPSWMGRSYFLPVRLSTIVSVSAIAVPSVNLQSSALEPGGARRGRSAHRTSEVIRVVFGGREVGVDRVRSRAIGAVRPARQVLQLAALAAEGPPLRLHRIAPAEDAQRR